MSFDRLQKCIRSKKSPVALTLGAGPESIPSHLRKTAADRLGPGREAEAEALLQFSLGLMEAAKDAVPAVIFRVPYWEALGWPGGKALDQAAFHARELGLFVIADARRSDAGEAALAYGRGWLSQEGVNADCLSVNAYQGSDAIAPLLELCRREDKCLFTVVRTSNPSAGEVQTLVSGDRVVCQALGDLAERLGKNDVGQMGYSPVGAIVGAAWPSDLRALRKRLEHTFFLVPAGGDGECSLEDARYAFDKYGRGALVAVEGAAGAWMAGGGDEADYAAVARAALEQARDEIRQFVTIL